MLCPKCKCELRIHKSYLRITGDKSPDTPAKAEQVLELVCKNPQCAAFNQTTEQSHIVYSGE